MDLACMGELLIDFVATETGLLRAASGFVRAPGGAPANVAVAAARLGLKTSFIGAVGGDEFGSFLRDTLEKNGVDTRALTVSSRGPTPLAFVSLKRNAERDFLFYWQRTADQFLSRRDVPDALIRRARVFHHGSIGFIHASTRRVTLHALRTACRAKSTFVSCDPNLRLSLWPSESAARKGMLDAIANADLVKLNGEEMRFLTGTRRITPGIRALAEWTDAAILVTLGPRGAAFRWGRAEGQVPGLRVSAIDSTGAGDGFVAGFLCRLIQGGGDRLRDLAPDAGTLSGWVRYANAVGALATTKLGAIPSFPTRTEVASLLASSST